MRSASSDLVRGPAQRGTVYNISVAGTQNYFAAGILVHNKSPNVCYMAAGKIVDNYDPCTTCTCNSNHGMDCVDNGSCKSDANVDAGADALGDAGTDSAAIDALQSDTTSADAMGDSSSDAVCALNSAGAPKPVLSCNPATATGKQLCGCAATYICQSLHFCLGSASLCAQHQSCGWRDVTSCISKLKSDCESKLIRR